MATATSTVGDAARSDAGPVDVGRVAAVAVGNPPGPPLPQPVESEVRQAIELLFFAYRAFTGEADQLLGRYGFGRAHHRVIYFVARRPGMTVGELLMILRITKQSLARVLGELRREGFIVHRTDAGDRRRRRLYLAPEAEALEQTLTERQAALLARAFCEAGDTAAEGFRAVLTALVDPGDRARFVSPAQSAAIAPARSK